MNRYQILMTVISWIFPRRCPVCDRCLHPEEGLIHPRCRKLLEPIGDLYCMKCGRKVSGAGQEYCSLCRKKQPLFTQGRSLFAYEGAMKGCMYRFKYSNKREYADFFAEEAVKRMGSWIENTGAECIVPVPMYPKKQRRRGYNQAESLSYALSRQTGIPVEKKLIRRNRWTRALKTLNPEERRRELAGAFSICAGYRKREQKYRCILLVDDIYTTGSTADAAAEVLQEAGVRKILIFCAASAGGND